MVVVEFNPTIPHYLVFVQAKDPRINQGCSLLALQELARQKGYELIFSTEWNGIFVDSQYFDLFEAEIHYLYDPFQEKAPNYSSAPGAVNTQVKAVLSADSFSGIIWSVVANTNVAGAYKNASGDALDCRLGLGSANLVGITDGGPNLEGGCNLKVKDPLPAIDTVVIPSR